MSCYINEVTFGKPLSHLRMRLVAGGTNCVTRRSPVDRRLELTVPLLVSKEGRGLEIAFKDHSDW